MANHCSILAWRIPWTEGFSVPLPKGTEKGRSTEGTGHHKYDPGDCLMVRDAGPLWLGSLLFVKDTFILVKLGTL